MEDFIPFEMAKKLEEKGFSCKYPIAMYNEYNQLCPFYSFGTYYCDFGKQNSIAPTISQTLKWLRKEKNIYISIFIDDDSNYPVTYEIYKGTECVCSHQGEYFTLENWNKCELRALEYTLDNLI